MTIAPQREAVRRAERVADATERAVRTWWHDLLALIRAGPTLGLTRLHALALAHARRLPGLTRAALVDGLTDVWAWGADAAARSVSRTVLRRVFQQRGYTSWSVLSFLEGTPSPPGRYAPRRRAAPVRAQPIFADVIPQGILPDAPAVNIPDELLARVVLRRPSEASIRQRVEQLIAPFVASPRPDLVDPQRFAAQLVQSYSQGKSVQEIAQDLLPVADGARASARRVARTWGIDVANRSQWEAHESLGPDLVVGYRIHATPGPYSRSWHASRDGQEYFRNPRSGQKGFAQLPHPPREPADPAERPPGTPWLAWGCL